MGFLAKEIGDLEEKMVLLFFPWLIIMAIYVFFSGKDAVGTALVGVTQWQEVAYWFLFMCGIIMTAFGQKKGMYLLGEGVVFYLINKVWVIVSDALFFHGDAKQLILTEAEEEKLGLELVVFAVQLTFLACHAMWPDFCERTKQEHWTCRDVVKKETCSFIGLSLFLIGFLFFPFAAVVYFLQYYVGILILSDGEGSLPFFLLAITVICFGLGMLILRWIQNSRLLRWISKNMKVPLAFLLSIVMCIRVLVGTLDLESAKLSDGEIIGNAIVDSFNPANEISRLVYVIPTTLLVFYVCRKKQEEEKWNWFYAVICWAILFVTWVSGLKLAAGIPLFIKHLF